MELPCDILFQRRQRDLNSRAGTFTDLPHFECGPFNRLGTSPNLCYIPGPDPPTNSAGGNREEQQDRTSNIIQFELGWNPHGSKGFSRLALRIGNLISNHYTNLDDDGKSGTIAVTTEPQNIPLKVAVRWLLSLQPFSRKIQAVEIGKNNRIEQTPIHNLNLPANPHGYWLFGSLDFQSGNMISSHFPLVIFGGN